MAESPIVQGLPITFGCTEAIDRLKKGPKDWEQIIGSGVTYHDQDFNGLETLFWLNGSYYSSSLVFAAEYFFFGARFKRLAEEYPDGTMFGDETSMFTDPVQGYAGNCYILASMGGVAEYPDVLKNVFLT